MVGPALRRRGIVVAAILAAVLTCLAGVAGCASRTSAGTATATNLSRAQPSHVASQSLTVADVRRVFLDAARLETEFETTTSTNFSPLEELEFEDFSVPDYLAAVTAGADRVANPLSDRPATVSGPRRHQLIVEAVADWRAYEKLHGADAAWWEAGAAEFGEQGSPPHSRSQEVMFMVKDVGEDAIDFMVTPPGVWGSKDDHSWAWTVDSITVEGTSTARIVYSASTASNAKWSFRDPGMTYERVWRFTWDTTRQRWLVSDWPNREQFLARMAANVSDPHNALETKYGQPFYWGLP